MNLIELATIEEAINNLESQLDETNLTETQINHIYNEIDKLEDRKDKLLGNNRVLHRMPWYDETY